MRSSRTQSLARLASKAISGGREKRSILVVAFERTLALLSASPLAEHACSLSYNPTPQVHIGPADGALAAKGWGAGTEPSVTLAE